MKNNDDNLRFNERKLIMLALIARADKHLTSLELADLAGITPNNASRQLTKLTGQGYIWRKWVRVTAADPPEFKYKNLKRMGERVLEELWIRKQLKDETGDPKIVLNLKKNIPVKHLIRADKLKKMFFYWRWE